MIDIWKRISEEKPLYPDSRQLLESFIRSSNEQALNFISIGEFNTANHILRSCQQMLKSPVGEDYPALKFKTYNNIAHSQNIQGHVKLSLTNLTKALRFALQVNDIEDTDISYDGTDKMPIVETYINICNAFTF